MAMLILAHMISAQWLSADGPMTAEIRVQIPTITDFRWEYELLTLTSAQQN